MTPARADRRRTRPDPITTPRVACARRSDVLLPLPGETLLDAARRQSVPLASACGGHAVCGDCLVVVLVGGGALPAPDADELTWRERKRYSGDGRLACCVRVTGDCTIGTTYW